MQEMTHDFFKTCRACKKELTDAEVAAHKAAGMLALCERHLRLYSSKKK